MRITKQQIIYIGLLSFIFFLSGCGEAVKEALQENKAEVRVDDPNSVPIGLSEAAIEWDLAKAAANQKYASTIAAIEVTYQKEFAAETTAQKELAAETTAGTSGVSPATKKRTENMATAETQLKLELANADKKLLATPVTLTVTAAEQSERCNAKEVTVNYAAFSIFYGVIKAGTSKNESVSVTVEQLVQASDKPDIDFKTGTCPDKNK